MTIGRRRIVVGTIGVGLSAGALPLRSALAQALVPPPARSRETQSLFSEAARVGLERPHAAGAANPLDLAELVESALSAPQNDDVKAVADRAGLLLSEITRDERDGLAIEDPAPAAPRTLTDTLALDYRNLFASAQVSAAHKPELMRVAKFITSSSSKARYMDVASDTKVPWFVIGALHYREANLNFLGHLHNGDPLMLRTVHVPTSRPPAPWPIAGLSPTALWRASAKDALRRFPASTTWNIPSICFFLESYNGFGCRKYNIHTPYLWNYTQLYTRGGFPKDRVYSPTYVSKQAGLMAVLVAIRTIAPADVDLPA